MTPKQAAKKSAKKAATRAARKSEGWTDVEREAMKAHAREMKAEARRGRDRAASEADLLSKVAEMPEPDRGMATRLHALVTRNAPELTPKTWYGMPAYANDEGKVVCFFQSAAKFKTRYATFGFTDSAHLDDGSMWPTSFALKKLGAAEEAQIAALVKRAVR